MASWYSFREILTLQPEKADKEPMRLLYQRYKEVKLALDRKKQEDSSTPRTPETRKRLSEYSTTEFICYCAKLCLDVPTKNSRSRFSPQSPEEHTVLSTVATLETDSHYVALRAEKKRLQVVLHNYQNQFLQQHGRKVQSKVDREPLQREYQRYKVLTE